MNAGIRVMNKFQLEHLVANLRSKRSWYDHTLRSYHTEWKIPSSTIVIYKIKCYKNGHKSQYFTCPQFYNFLDSQFAQWNGTYDASLGVASI